MKSRFLLLMLCVYASSTFSEPQFFSSNIVIQLKCSVFDEEAFAGQGYKSIGSRTFNITVYSKNGKYFIKEQEGTYNPTWWGEGVLHTDLAKTEYSYARMDGESIWALAVEELALDSKGSNKRRSELNISRLNGHIRITSESEGSKYNPKSSFISVGNCGKTQNLF